jgi:periplasmic protein TonB
MQAVAVAFDSCAVVQVIERRAATEDRCEAHDWGYKSRRGGPGLSDEPPTSAGTRAAGSGRASAVLRLVPSELGEPTKPGGSEIVTNAWARDAEQADWCVDAEPTLAAGCSGSDSGTSTMLASERRAIHMTRQRIRAQAILAAAEPGVEQERRDRARRLAIVIGSAVLHAVGFVALATAVADLQPRERPATHEHLFEARAVVPIEPPPVSSPRPEAVEPQPQPVVQPQPKSSPQPKRSKPAHEHAHEHAQTSEPAPYELRGFELSSQGELAAGEPGGESWGRRGGTGAGGDRDAHEQATEPAASKPDEQAQPRGGLLEPEYPPELERKGIEGSVLVKVWIDEHGHVIKAEVVESSHEESFDHNALMAAQRQEWTPAIDGGEPVASTRRYRVHFRLR